MTTAPSAVPDPHVIRTVEQLEALLGPVQAASVVKEVPTITAEYRAWIEASPFCILATSGPGGLDASPRGDPPGFVTVEDEKTLLLPERRGNNRADSLRNLLVDPRVALLFLIPGVGETLRVNGTAQISVAPALLERLRIQGKPPRCVLVIHVDTIYFQCARAMLRSGLWQAPPPSAGSKVPTAGQILEALSHASIDAKQYDGTLHQRQRDSLY